MSAYCPLCGQPALALWKKAFLSPLAPVPCESCDIELKVTWVTYLRAISMGSILFVFAYLLLETDSLMQYAGFGMGFIVMLIGQVYFMPLEPVVDYSNNDSVDNDPVDG